MSSVSHPARPSEGRAGAGEVGTRPRRRPRYVPLLHRVAGLNVLLLFVAVAVTVILLAPRKVSSFTVDAEVLVVAAAVAAVVVANVYLLRRLVGPVQALTALARRVDLTSPGPRMSATEASSEAGELALTFNEMLDRLQSERREATGWVLAAQEAERVRIAQELHDQVGQELTAVLLGLSWVEARAPKELEAEIRAVEDVVSSSLDDVRRIAVELRPEALDDLALASALAVLAERPRERLGLEVTVGVARDLPDLVAQVELVIYRVAQEALTNVVRHSGSPTAELNLEREDGRLLLTVRDHGRGLPPGTTAGAGMRGMGERAALIGAGLEVRSGAGGPGCEVRLEVPLDPATWGAPRPDRHP